MTIGRKKAKPATKRAGSKRAEPSTQTAQATAVGITSRQLREYFAEGCPRGPIAAIVAWRAEHKRRPAGGELFQLSPRARIELKNKREEYRRRKFKNDFDQGRLILKADAIEVITAICLRFKSRVEAIPDECQMLFPAEVRAMVKRELAEKFRHILKEMSLWKI